MDELVKNAGDARQVKDAKQREKIIAHNEKEDLNWLLSHRRGRRFYWNLLGKAGVFETSFSETNNNITNFKEGRRTIGLFLLNKLIEVKPDAYMQMVRESEEDEVMNAASMDRKGESKDE